MAELTAKISGKPVDEYETEDSAEVIDSSSTEASDEEPAQSPPDSVPIATKKGFTEKWSQQDVRHHSPTAKLSSHRTRPPAQEQTTRTKQVLNTPDEIDDMVSFLGFLRGDDAAPSKTMSMNLSETPNLGDFIGNLKDDGSGSRWSLLESLRTSTGKRMERQGSTSNIKAIFKKNAPLKTSNQPAPVKTPPNPPAPSNGDDTLSFMDFLKEDPNDYRKKPEKKNIVVVRPGTVERLVKSRKKGKTESETNSPPSKADILGSRTTEVDSDADDISLLDFLRVSDSPANRQSGSKLQKRSAKGAKKEASKPIVAKKVPRRTIQDDTISEVESDEVQLLTLDEIFTKVFNEPTGVVASSFFMAHSIVKSTPETLQMIIDKFTTAESQIIRMQCLDSIDAWLDIGHVFFTANVDVLQNLVTFCDNVQSNQTSLLQKKAESIKTKLEQKATPVPVAKDFLAEAPAPVLPRVVGELSLFSEVDAAEVARQMTLVEEAIFQEIKPWEFLNQSWMKSNKMELAPNICKMIALFNQTSNWIKMEILTQEDPKMRARVVSKVLAVCEHLRRLHNFNGVYEVVAALHSSPVFRLKSTFAMLSKSKLSFWQRAKEIVDHPSTLREAISNARPPLIPYLGMYLTDMIYIDEGNKNPGNGQLNFSRFQLLARTLKEIQEYQSYKYCLVPVPEVQNFILSRSGLITDEATQYNFSTFIEPRAGTTQTEMPPEFRAIIEARAALAGSRLKKDSKKATKARQANRQNVVAMLMKLANETVAAGNATSPPETSTVDDPDLALKSRIAIVNGLFDTLVAHVNHMQKALTSMSTTIEQTREQTLLEIREQQKASLQASKGESLGATLQRKDDEIFRLKARIRELEARNGATTVASSSEGDVMLSVDEGANGASSEDDGAGGAHVPVT